MPFLLVNKQKINYFIEVVIFQYSYKNMAWFAIVDYGLS